LLFVKSAHQNCVHIAYTKLIQIKQMWNM